MTRRIWLAAFSAAIFTAIVTLGGAVGAFTPGFSCCGNSACDSLKPNNPCTVDSHCTFVIGHTKCCGDDPDEFGCSAEPGEEG